MMTYLLSAFILTVLLINGCDNNNKIDVEPEAGLSGRNTKSATCLDNHKDDLVNCLKHQIEHHTLVGEAPFTPLSNERLKQFNQDGHITVDQYNDLVTFAYERKHPLIFREGREVEHREYSINLLWIHATAPKGQRHFMGDNDLLLNEKVTLPILHWQRKQPEAHINFWYDGFIVNDLAIHKTIEIIRGEGIKIDHVKFRDLNEVKLVKENRALYSENIPVYFRVDLSKALIADHVIKNDGVIAVVTDNDVVSITRRHLFDKKTLELLDLNGHLFGQSGGVNFENSFFMLSGGGELLFEGKKYLDWHYENIIENAVKQGLKKLVNIGQDELYRLYSQPGNHAKNFAGEVLSRKLPLYLIINPNKSMVFPPSHFAGFLTYETALLEKLKEMLY